MKHLLDYDVLKEYGFDWATTSKTDQCVLSYITKFDHTDLHGFGSSIWLQRIPHPTFMWIWHLSVIDSGDSTVLFQGQIRNTKALKVILKSTLVFKKKKKQCTY